MNLKTYALWACLLFASVSSATQTHRIRQGETLGHVAEKFGVSTRQLLQANPGIRPESIQIGQVIRIPSGDRASRNSSSNAPARPASSGQTYTVRQGDNNWTIAARVGMTVARLNQLNPGVNWRKLRPGDKVRIETAARRTSAATASAPVRAAVIATAGTVVVGEGQNDWIIARRLGITVSQLHQANPGVNWRSLQIGQRLRVPGAARVATAAGPATAIRTKRAKVVRDNVIVRGRPSTGSSRVTMVDQGRIAAIVDRKDGWYRLQFSGGTSGWVRGDMLAPVRASDVTAPVRRPATVAQRSTPPRASAPRRTSSRPSSRPLVAANLPSTGVGLLDRAQRYMGVRYRWGGTTSRGFDCSGFVGHVFRTQGVRLPRTSIEQSRVGQAVSRGELRQGDLVFFRTRGRRISHVGIYMGGGRFIHASSGGGSVRTDTLNSGYYNRRFAGARRVARISGVASVASREARREETRKPVQVAQTNPDPQAQPPQPVEQAPRVQVGADEIGR